MHLFSILFCIYFLWVIPDLLHPVPVIQWIIKSSDQKRQNSSLIENPCAILGDKIWYTSLGRSSVTDRSNHFSDITLALIHRSNLHTYNIMYIFLGHIHSAYFAFVYLTTKQFFIEFVRTYLLIIYKPTFYTSTLELNMIFFSLNANSIKMYTITS